MKKPKAISFDLWGTLIKGSPAFKDARAELIIGFSNNLITKEEINLVFKKVKQSFDENVENFGLSYSDLAMYKTIINELNLQTTPVNLRHQCHELFISNPPELVYGIKPILADLINSEIKLCISSNTLLINGDTLEFTLKNILGLESYFKYMFFSDKIGFSKPHVKFFQTVHENLGLLKEDILHVGDNLLTDIAGANNYGFRTHRVKFETISESLTNLFIDNYEKNFSI